MTRDLRFYALAICLPAIVLTIVGLVFLQRQVRVAAAQEQQTRVALARQLEADVREALEDSSTTPAIRQKALFAAGADDFHPLGVFAWVPRTGLLWTNGVPPHIAQELTARKLFKDWTDGSRAAAKRPPHRGHFTAADGTSFIVWARAVQKDDDAIYGVLFAEDPTAPALSSSSIWPLAVVLVLLLAGVLGAGTLLLLRAAAKARREDAQKTSFVSNVSHELKTPLAAISLWADLLTLPHANDAQRAHAVEVIRDENGRMIRLVENLLNFARLEEGRRRYNLQFLDLATLATDTADLVRADFAEHGLTVSAPASCTALADADAVKQILVNLLGNAAKYAASEGPVELAVTRSTSVARVEVRDHGPGLTPEQRAHVFERFYQADNSLTGKKPGLGLGLAISLSLARDMQGVLAVAPRTGGGCVFSLDLPVPSC